MRKLHFLSGLPRSGSTLVSKLLCQNPEIFASSTSPFLEYVIPAAAHLYKVQNEHSAGHYVNVKRILSTAAFAFYETDKKHVIDKNRGWIENYDAINKELQEDPKIILNIRPIEEVVASFYKIVNQVNGRSETPEQIFLGRVAEVYQSLMKMAHLKDKVCIVTYDELTKDTIASLRKIEDFIGAEHHDYDINNIIDDDPEDDSKWGIKDLHKIRSSISVNSLPPESVMTKSELNFCKQLTKDLYNAYEIPLF